MSENEILAQAITEAVCKQFQDWLGRGPEPASLDLKTAIYNRVLEVLKNGVEI